MSGEGNLPHIPGFIIKVSSLLFSEIKNTHLGGKELGRIQHNVQVYLYHGNRRMFISFAQKHKKQKNNKEPTVANHFAFIKANAYRAV